MLKTTAANPKYLIVNELRVPVRYFEERRNTIRASFGSQSVNIRIPRSLGKKAKEKETLRLLDWARDTLVEQPELLNELALREYQDGEVLKVGDQEFFLELRVRSANGSRAKRKGNRLILELDNRLSMIGRNRHIRQLVSRLVAEVYYPEIKDRLIELNNEHLQCKIKGLKLKLSYTNWGSCSSDGNINISTRLLFAPKEVVDYVLIHELVHLVHHHHGPSFWQLVGKIMPNYKRHEKWLKENVHRCNF